MLVLPSSQVVLGYNQQGPKLEDQLGNSSITKLVHDNSTLILNQTSEKWIYKSGEDITITPEVINMGNKTVNMYYLEPAFFLEIKNRDGIVVWPQSTTVAYIPEYAGVKALKPGEHFGVKPWTTPTGPMYDPFPIILTAPENYTALSVVSFKFEPKPDGSDSYVSLWSKPVQITILPEKIPEFPFTGPILLASFVSVVAFYRIGLKK